MANHLQPYSFAWVQTNNCNINSTSHYENKHARKHTYAERAHLLRAKTQHELVINPTKIDKRVGPQFRFFSRNCLRKICEINCFISFRDSFDFPLFLFTKVIGISLIRSLLKCACLIVSICISYVALCRSPMILWTKLTE